MKVGYGDYIREKVIKNLLSAQNKIAEKGNVNEIIIITKYILKISYKLDNELLDLGLEEDNNHSQEPPNKSE